MAAAAAWSRSRGVAGVRPTTGLFSIFTLLCLVCLSSSLMDKDLLEEFKEKLQKAQKQLDEAKEEMKQNHQESQRKMDSLKAQHKSETATTPELMSEFRSLMDPLIAFLKKASIECPVFLRLEGLLEKMKDFMEETSKKNEELALQMEMAEKKMRKSEKFIKFLEEQEAEL